MEGMDQDEPSEMDMAEGHPVEVAGPRREITRQMLASAGYSVTEVGVRNMRERVRALEARWTGLVDTGEE